MEVANGPIPPPSMLGLYGEVSPDLPDRIMRMAEKDQDAQVKVIDRASSAEAFGVRVGALAPLILAAIFAIVSAYLFSGGQHAGAFVALMSAVGVWIGPQVTSKKKHPPN